MKHTTIVKHHKECAAAAIFCSIVPDFNQRTISKVGPRVLSNFLDELIKWEAEIVAVLMRNLEMKWLNVTQEIKFDNATRCYLCRQEFKENETKKPKIRDHDHITGEFLGATHSKYNLERPVSFQIPVCFYNFRGYDEHLIVHEFKTRPDREIKVIGQNMEQNFQV